MIIDTHVHLDDGRYDDDLDSVIKRAYDGGVKVALIPGANPKDLPKAVEIANRYEHIFFAVGVHPYYAGDFDLEYLKKFASHPKCIAVGECGLDYYRLSGSDRDKGLEKELQKEIFRVQIALAIELKKPLIVHIREASFDSKEILLQEGANRVGGVLHCYNASEILLSLSSEGFYFGIGGVVTFKNAKKLVEVLPKIPISKIVLETDAPYLTPHPHRGERNEPLYTTFVLKKVSEILDIDDIELKETIYRNSCTLFREFRDI